ncbi:MAG TPA: protein kinase [Vicinamibacterales bacterium]|nr:protein kinase [Vicinamibacterales bacterium]
MADPRWNRAKQVFHDALEKTGPERARFVSAACADDLELRTQVEALLKAHDDAGAFLSSPTGAPDEAARAAVQLAAGEPPEGPGARIGPYKLLQVIGEGGFGIVYMAEQEQPLRRRVALKIIKLGMDTREVIARFEAERQALALMEHPNIARVFDAGATQSGRPYFVMELVQGVPITSYCDANRLSTRERLDLFADVCKAVHHAHEKGLIHRDIKPSNVMVTLHDGIPVPKIIDFGVAKATNQRLTEKTLFTAYGQFVGTPAYMSPEQAEMSGLELDRRSDIYSLGVLVYELLTGTTPFEAETLRQRGFLEMLRVIQEEDPPTPSARLSSLGDRLIEVAGRRHVDPAALAKLVQGDLDWIVMKAIDKDRRRRYGSALEFLNDIARYSRDEPVIARPPSAAYRLGKFAKRQRVPLLAAASVAVALAVGGVVALTRPSPTEPAAAATSGVRAFPRVDNSNEVLSLSPDGTKAAFMNYDKGQNLAVFDVTNRQTTQLTDFDWTPGSSWVYGAAWSPDGRRIAYTQCPLQLQSGVPCELRAVTLTRESSAIVRSQTELMWPGGWLPDGSAIVVTAVRLDPTVARTAAKTATIGLLPSDGGAFVPVRSISGWTGRVPERPSVSPDGRWIAFSEGSPGDIHVINRDGRTARRITDHPAEDHFPVWSPDGRHLAFLSERGGSAALWIVAFEDGQPAGEPVRVKDGMQDVIYFLGWTARGLAYSQYQRTDDVYTAAVDPASGEPRGDPRLIPYRRTGHNTVPEWSPDGKYLAFVSSSSSSLDQPDRRLVLLPSGGGEAREFPTPAHRLWTLRWFGDSRGLGITGHDARGQRTLFRLTIASGEWQTFPLRASPAMQWNGMYFDWNTDGTRYFYAWQDDWAPSELTIIERELQSDSERIVYRGKSEARMDRFRGLRFSPDRRSLSFRGIGGIHLLDVEATQVQVVHDEVPGEARLTGAPPEGPTWSPNGRALLAPRIENRETDRRDTELRLIPADGAAVRRIPFPSGLTRLLTSRPGAPRPSIQSVVWSPDGGRLAFALRTSQVESFMIEDPLSLTGTETHAR